mmetsp:Transcript_23516/g.20423  ORF Transcript_23516/g.20423 Transcript_23516/m.20423 type:complete len:191 (+) Transcript_23516:180-752(+)
MRANYRDVNGKYLALPRVEYFDERQRHENRIQEVVFNQTLAIDDLNDPRAKDSEIFLDIQDTSKPQYIYNIKRNESTLSEREAKFNPQSLSENLLVLYVDTLSRVAAKRKLPKTMRWFREQQDKGDDGEFESFEFFRYHSVRGYTSYNVHELMFGKTYPKTSGKHNPTGDDRPKSIAHTFKENGFITSQI